MIPVSWLHKAGQLQRRSGARAFLAAVQDPEQAQRERLLDILGRNAATAYGRQHGFAGIRTVEDYRSLPLLSPTEMATWVNRTLAGEDAVLTVERPVYYVQTTGSTGVPKHVPVTPSYKTEFQRSLHASMWHLYQRFPEAYRSRVLYFVGSANDGVAPDGNPIGTMSGFTFSSLPKLVRAMYAWPQELFALRDLRTRNYLALHLAILGDPSLCGTIFPLSLVLLFRELERRADELAFHLEKGTLPDDLALSDEQRRFYQSLIRPRPDLAKALRQGAKGDLVAHALPSLRLAICWTGGTAGLYVPELERWLGEDVRVRDAVYSAAEGWMNVPMGDAEPGGVVSVTGHYLEFIPEQEFMDGGTRTLGVHELADGERYAVVLTTSAGMYRYVLGDIVEVCGFFEATPRIRFVRKVGAHCNLVGEKLDENHVNLAMAQVLEQLGGEASWFCLAPQAGEVPSYRLYLEPGEGLQGKEQAVATALDAGLCALARDYKAHREDVSLGPVTVQVAKPGAFEQYRAEQAAAGVAVAQQKAKHLVDDAGRVPALLRGDA